MKSMHGWELQYDSGLIADVKDVHVPEGLTGLQMLHSGHKTKKRKRLTFGASPGPTASGGCKE